MSILNHIKSSLLPKSIPVFYDKSLSASYSTPSVTGSCLIGKRGVIIHNGGTLYLSIIQFLELEEADLLVYDLTKEDEEIPAFNNISFCVYVIDWEPQEELLRLKTIKDVTYTTFMEKHVNKGIDIIRKIVASNNQTKIVSVLPSFALSPEFGYTLYGIACHRLMCDLRSLVRHCGSKRFFVLYGKALKAEINVNADITRKTGVLHHVLLREQISSIVAMLCGPVGEALGQDIIKVGALQD